MSFIRACHAVLAVLATLAFLTGELGLVHAWLGYAVAAVIVLRLLAAASGTVVGARQLGLQRFYPRFHGLRFDNALSHPAVSRVLIAAIAACVIGATATGIALDRGRAIGLADAAIVQRGVVQPAVVHPASERPRARPQRSLAERALKEAHELLGNLLLPVVGAHVAYLLLFRRPLARFMLFLPSQAARRPPEE